MTDAEKGALDGVKRAQDDSPIGDLCTNMYSTEYTQAFWKAYEFEQWRIRSML